MAKPTPYEKRQLRKRIEKKVDAVHVLKNNITCIRNRYRRDLRSKDERVAMTALAVAVIDKTAERVGNRESARSGHYGITGLRCRHVSTRGNKVRLRYVGKSGVVQDKSFSDADMAKLLRKRLCACKRRSDPVFMVNEVRIPPERINRYLAPYGITAKDMRGYLANRFMVQALDKYKGRLCGEKERKKAFLIEVKKVAGKVGHQPATLRKHYLLPNFEDNYVKYGHLPSVA